MQKNGIFACHYAKTPQKVGDFLYIFLIQEQKSFCNFKLLVLIVLISLDQFVNTYRFLFLS